MLPPPQINTLEPTRQELRADSQSFTTIQPGAKYVSYDFVITILTLPGKGLPIDSYVFLPIITKELLVWSLKKLRSEGMFHGSLPSFPMNPFRDTAAIIFI